MKFLVLDLKLSQLGILKTITVITLIFEFVWDLSLWEDN